MNKYQEYQEALNGIIECYEELESRVGNDPNKVKEFNNIKTLQELINQNKPLTLKKCIKLWEDAGFEIKSCTKEKFEVYKQWTEEFNEYKINTEAEVIIDRGYLYISGNFPNEYIQLLIKTLKALEVEDENN